MKTMPRLKGFDYRRPFFYMVTVKRREGAAAEPFSAIAADENGLWAGTYQGLWDAIDKYNRDTFGFTQEQLDAARLPMSIMF